MSTRATKSGINREVAEKLASKYDAQLAGQCMQWISQQIGEGFDTSGESSNVYTQLKSGQRLARLVNVISPGKVSQKMIDGANKMAFKQMELINKFIDACKSLGVPDHEAFATVDLYEEQNMVQVITCISALMRKFGLGPKEATENKREFTAEQMKAGQSVIGLQMGTNRGASQAGMSMGNTRHIVD